MMINIRSSFCRGLFIAAWCVSIFLLQTTPTHAMDLDAAKQFVTTVADDCLASFSGKKLTLAERRRLLGEKISRYGDPAQTSADILGRYWSHADKDTQARFAALLVDYVVATWSSQLADISQTQKISIRNAEENGDKAVIHSLSTSNEDTPSNVDWTIRASGERYSIADIAVDGVSLIRTMTADFNSFLRNNGGKLEILMDTMNKKIAARAITSSTP